MAKCWLLLQFLAFLLPATSATSCHTDDLRALQGFAGNLSGGGVLLRAVWTGVSCCGWEGVSCDGTSGRVTGLRLPGRGLAGPIPRASLAGLAQLEELNLANNKLIGTIPSWIADEHSNNNNPISYLGPTTKSDLVEPMLYPGTTTQLYLGMTTPLLGATIPSQLGAAIP
uniref:Leucine-rich repeat-containing N-terminal plant-type domain-containing protein n=1 Tax=Aegilops tauschii subsp. strangulata TaxID=200361 RepID=A0A453MFW3_AEGTS